MKFVFDLDGTLCFDGMTMSKELQEVLLTAPKYGHEIIFATARSYRDCLSILEGELKKLTVVGLNGGEVFQDELLVSQYTYLLMLSERLLATVIPITSLILLMIPLIMLYKILIRFLSFQMLTH